MSQHFTSIARGLNMGSFVESKQEFLEKGRKAQIGEIREWRGQKFQKQPNGGWLPVKQGTKGTKKEGEMNWKKATEKDMAALPVGTKISYHDELSGTDVVTTKVKENSWEADGNTYTDEEVSQSVSHPDAKNHKMEKPSSEKKELTSEQKKWLDRFFDPQNLVNGFEESFDLSEGVEGFSKWLKQGRQLGIDVLAENLGLFKEEASKIYDEKLSDVFKEIKKNSSKYGFPKVTKKKLEALVSETIMDYIEYMDWDYAPDTGEELLEDEDFVDSLTEAWGERFSPEEDKDGYSPDDIREHWEDVKRVVEEVFDSYMEEHKREDEE